MLLGAISGKHTRRSITVKAKLSNTHQYRLRDSKLTIRTNLRRPFGTFKHKRKITIEEYAQLEYSFKADLNLEKAQEKFLLVSDLLTLLSGSSRSLNWPRLHIGRGKSLKRYEYFYGCSRNLSEPAKFFDCWVTFPQISDSFGNILQSWDDAQKKLGSGLQLFVRTLKSNSLHLEHKFANFIWGLEVLHRLKHPTAVQSEKFKEKIDRIINDVKLQKDRDWLSERLRNAHEPSLQQRLKYTVDSLGLGFEEKSLQDFCKVCADLRNDLSHFGGQRTFPNYDEMIQVLHEKFGALELIYHAITLTEIGIDNKIIQNFIFSGRHSYKFMQTMKRAGLTRN